MLELEYKGWLLLCRLFQYPEQSLLTTLQDPQVKQLAMDLELAGLQGASALNTALSAVTEDKLEDLAVDYTRLFITGVPKTIAVPYASVYIDPMALVAGVGVRVMKEFMARAGIAPKEQRFEWLDHIGEELAFASYLLASGKEEHLDLYEEFVQDHLLKWAPEFFARMQAGAREPLYRAMATLALDIIERIKKS